MEQFSTRYETYENWLNAQYRRFYGKERSKSFYRIRSLHQRFPDATLDELYGRKYFRNMVVLNASGSGIEKEKRKWSFTTDVTMYLNRKVYERESDGMAYFAEEVAERIIANSGLHNPTFDTSGSELDRPVKKSEFADLGMLKAELSVDDKVLGVCDFRYRQSIYARVDEVVKQMDKDGKLYYGGSKK